MQISSRNLYEHYSPSQDYVCPALTKPSADLYVNLQSELHVNIQVKRCKLGSNRVIICTKFDYVRASETQEARRNKWIAHAHPIGFTFLLIRSSSSAGNIEWLQPTRSKRDPTWRGGGGRRIISTPTFSSSLCLYSKTCYPQTRQLLMPPTLKLFTTSLHSTHSFQQTAKVAETRYTLAINYSHPQLVPS